MIGGNVSSINVIEGDEVNKGKVLAYLSHPDIITVQTDYINTVNRLKFLRKDFERQKKLYEEGVGSGETFQRAESELESAKGHLNGMEAQLRQLHINPTSLKNRNIQQRIPILSPINGAVQKVNIKTGQCVEAKSNMFEIINTEHVHAEIKHTENLVPGMYVRGRIAVENMRTLSFP